MKKIKAGLLIAAIAASITASIANIPQPYCTQQEQYYKMNTPWGFYFYPAGRLGIDYVCEYSPLATCTYYRPAGCDQFIPCQQGQFMPWCAW